LPIRINQLDVTDDVSAKDAVQAILSETGRIDVLVNNAGYVLNGIVSQAGCLSREGDTSYFCIFTKYVLSRNIDLHLSLFPSICNFKRLLPFIGKSF
jgi:NAD(P)-dependent dehydrogenase (short-subunit alcohol dehydrogenase family)